MVRNRRGWFIWMEFLPMRAYGRENGIGSNLADTTPFAGLFYGERIYDLTLVSKTAIAGYCGGDGSSKGRFS